ncbi:Uncharacterised protein [Klebsiella pneumoniae]|nr:Uncharacterised protein [Klebsiella pneumoniae]SXA73653.1 Uncharacterised protein [Klebsiella pneumoniae]VAU27738.1 Uncharacterised protein [Klebsiella pneumoniae]
MDIQAPYYRQVALLMQVLPYVAVEREFALKGGTAINPLSAISLDYRWISTSPGCPWKAEPSLYLIYGMRLHVLPPICNNRQV